MVTFEMESKVGTLVTYEYYPEGNREFCRGLFVLNTDTEDYEVTKLAELDGEEIIPAAEINRQIDEYNALNNEMGLDEHIEHVTEDEHKFYYADHAMQEIYSYLFVGEIPEKGTAYWEDDEKLDYYM